ncbi:MaoC family dehydratase N-terminal domain-containing protein [Aquincola tertiaricarbonis]|uniref:MaoC family dehydratase N-terminal domain-containing protein n=1 Tax=Aquincola tertiaricarbonis TaxID=391953 RepID=A0ABY4SBU5_AQUTE|nr:MaoC family dehydratase N-terminal domain-containing protein [Aquincola tertiaricarbonis]URI09939.1 MaoC family dehydratase N-terminal domain-containing protein [Aquincola tertiaricarbonis]
MTIAEDASAAGAHDYSAWIGRSETRHDLIAAAPLAGLAATLDRDEPTPTEGTPVPPLWHWIYFNPQALAREVGPDGHPRRGGFLPPVSLPRRMWAGGRLAFTQPLRVGERGERKSTIQSVATKQGRSGPLVFVTVRHELSGDHGLALTEEHDIVYREAPQPGAPEVPPQPAPADAAFTREIVPDPVLLFRYSALTFNGHRIHYDQPYVTGVEGYPGLIVHGPLIATLLLDHLRDHLREKQPGATVARFSFKALRPVFDIHRFQVCGRPDGDRRFALWARDHQGHLAMQASAELA